MKNKILGILIALLLALPSYSHAIQMITNVSGIGASEGDTYRISGNKAMWTSMTATTATNASALTTTSTSFEDITGMSITLTTRANRVLVGFSGIVYNDTVASLIDFDVDIDGVSQGGIISIAEPVNSYRCNASFVYLSAALTAASHTIKIKWKVSANTGNLRGDIYTTKMWVKEVN